MPTDRVLIRGYDLSGTQVVSETYSTYEWYEGLHPIIDECEKRVELGVRRIEGTQFGDSGQVTVSWRVVYSEAGAPIEEWVTQANGSTKPTVL